MTQPIFDAGFFILQIIIGFVCLAFYRKMGALMLVVSVFVFLLGGIIILTGNDVAFTKLTIPSNVTSTQTNSTSGKTLVTTMKIITPQNETDYLIGNSQFPIKGTGQIWMGYSLIIIAIVCSIIFADQTIKGRLILGD